MSKSGSSLPWRPSRRVLLFSGPMGSGKTEVAINFALAARREGVRPVRIVDLDFVNPYFCARERAKELGAVGVEVISAPWGRARGDAPVLTPEMVGALKGGEGLTTVDLGGVPAGGAMLGSLREHLPPEGVEHLFVMNPYRAGTRTPEEAAEVARAVEEAVGVRITGVVSNPHLGRETRPEEVLAGHPVVEEGARLLSIPVVFLACSREVAVSLPRGAFSTPIFAMDFFVRMPWEG